MTEMTRLEVSMTYGKTMLAPFFNIVDLVILGVVKEIAFALKVVRPVGVAPHFANI